MTQRTPLVIGGVCVGLIAAAATTVIIYSALGMGGQQSTDPVDLYSADPKKVYSATIDQPRDRYAHWPNQDAALIWRRAVALDFEALSGASHEIEPFFVFMEQFEFSVIADDPEEFSDERVVIEVCLGVFGHSVMQSNGGVDANLRARMIDVSLEALFDEAVHVKGAACAALWALGFRNGQRGVALAESVQAYMAEQLKEIGVAGHAESVWSGFAPE